MRIRFGEFCLEADTRQLTRQGDLVPLSPKAFQLLQLLLEMRPKALSTRELYRHLWPDTHVEKANLRNLVAEIRAAIDDEPRPGLWIRTVFGYGYAFAGEAVSDSDPRTPSPYYLVHGTQQHRLFEGENVIGRDPEATVVIDALGISRRHATITVQGPLMFLDDLESKNGTFLNGERVRERVRLESNAEVRLGLLKTHIRAAMPSGSTVTVL